MILAVKVLLAPAFVVLASIAARRFGPRIGGLVGGLPVVGGPILLVYALEHGGAFAAGAATGSLLGIVSLMSFVVAYGRLASRVPWGVSLPLGWAAFALSTLAFSTISISAPFALVLVAVVLVLAPLMLPRASSSAGEASPLPRWDLPLRAVSALVIVLVLTAAAGWLGPQLSGLLAPFPVIASVLAAFTHGQRGGDGELLHLLRGLLLGYGAYALFCFSLATSLQPLGVAGGFALACAVALLCQGAVFSWQTLRAPQAAPSEEAAQARSPA